MVDTVTDKVQPIRIAIMGCGFWSHYQVAGWQELSGVEVVAAMDPVPGKAKTLADARGIASVYTDAEQLLDEARPDVVDIIADVHSHAHLARLVADRGLPVICQKPMAPSVSDARDMVAHADHRGAPFYVHENWRWQTPLRALKAALLTGEIGDVYRARLDFATGFPVFDNQPFLRNLKQFILSDMGSHIFDAARFFFGEAKSLYCRTGKAHRDIQGEDIATAVMGMGGVTVTCNMSYAGNYYEHDRFPETFAFVEGTRGTIELSPDYWLRVTTADGTTSRRFTSPRYEWADPRYDVVHASIVACNRNLLGGLRGDAPVETTGKDNLKTVELVFAAYESASSGQVVRL